MLSSSYKLIFSVRISHSYFHKKTKSLLDFQPSEISKGILTQYNIVLRQNSSGFDLLCNTNEPIATVLMTIKSATGVSSFDFDFIAKDSDFHSYTEIPDNVGGLVYSSASKLNQKENENIMLHPEFFDDENRTKLGRLHIHFTDLMEFCTIGTPVNFTISFASRAIQLHYCIINSGSSVFHDLSIASISLIQFGSPKKSVLHDGQNAINFTSECLIALSDLTEQVFELKNDGATLIARLPIPNMQSLRIDLSNGKALYYSELYVYV